MVFIERCKAGTISNLESRIASYTIDSTLFFIVMISGNGRAMAKLRLNMRSRAQQGIL